jgi:two-component system, NarL family, invasion response regulator UvrY
MQEISTRRFLLIDDHEVVRSGINVVLGAIYNPVAIDEACDGEKAIAILKKNKYDLILLDIQMPNTDTFGLLEYIGIKFPNTKVLIFSMNSELIFARRYLRAGAKGFVSKDAPLEELCKAIDLALNNKRYFSEKLQELMAEEIASETSENPFDKLQAKEFEITTLFITGENIANVSKILNIKTSTAGMYKNKIFDKLGINSFVELQELYKKYHQ